MLVPGAALLLAAVASAQNQVALPAHSAVYNGFTRGYTFTAQNNFIIQQVELPLNAFQTGDSAGFYLRVNGANTFFNVGGSSAVQTTSIIINPGDVVDVFGNWSPAAPGTFTAHNSYSVSATGHPTTIEGAATTLYRNGVQNDIGNPAYVQGSQVLGLTTTGQIGRVWIYTSPPAGLFANFTAAPTAGPVGMTVNFTDTTFTSDPGGVLTWDWDLDGDGLSDSNVQNPSFTYNACGAYNVSLTVTDASHPASTVTKNGFIQVGISPIAPSFTFAPLAPGVFQFTDTSSPVPSAWAWDLDGDGITDSTLQNPVWAYASPCTSVNVSLQVWSNCAGPWSTSKPVVLSPLAATAVPFSGGNGTTSTTFVGNMFDVSVTAPEGINVCALTQGIYTYVGNFHVDVYVTEDTYLGKEANASAWRLVASGSGTCPTAGALTPATGYPVALNNSFYLPSGNYGIAVYLSQPGGTMYVCYSNGPLGPYSNGDITFFPNTATAPGRSNTGLFTGAGFAPRCWNGTFHYSKAGNGDLAGYGFFGPGCPGTLGTSHLTANSLPVIGTTMHVTVDNLPTNVAIMMTGLSKTNWLLGALPFDLGVYGATGCNLRVSPDANLLLLGAAGSAVWPFNIPNGTGLIGLNLYNQAVVLSPGTNAAGAVGSDAAGMMIGL
ncbi:MAG: PKD domain-containing protein [Planctomycetota bacterium]